MLGILVFYAKNRKVLLKALCQNIAKSREKYTKSDNWQELQKEMVEVEEKTFDTFLDALFYYKSLTDGQIKQYAHYQYLAIDPVGTPCLTLSSDTLTQGKIFVGPFRNRFFISDFTDKFAQKFALPALREERECRQILDFYLNEKIWTDCRQEIDELEKDLQFAQAEKMIQDLEPLRKYFFHLQFIQESKKLSFNHTWQGQELVVKDGLLQKYGDLQFRLDYKQMQYQERELYALPLDELDEREIVYHFFLHNVSR